jgi:hypothetical protein
MRRQQSRWNDDFAADRPRHARTLLEGAAIEAPRGFELLKRFRVEPGPAVR